MATLTASRASAAHPVAKPVGGGVMSVYYGSYDIATDIATNDVIELCRVPAGFVALGGHVRIEDIDTNATETFDIDIGTSADSDALGNFGVRTGDAVTDYLPEGGTLLPLHGTLKDGPVTFSSETTLRATIVAAPATAAAGTITLVVYGVNP